MKNISVPLAFVLGLLFMLVALGIFWLAGRSVSEETVFWQAIDNNLNSRGLILDTEISVPVQAGEATVLSSRLGFNFAPEPSFGWRQFSLLYDHDLAALYGFGPQPDAYKAWHEQASCGSGTDVYLRHNLHAESPPADWNDYLDSLGIQPPLGEAGVEVVTEAPESLQHFMMYSLTNGSILFYGKLSPAERGEIVDHLRKAYLVDFDNVRTVKAAGRLLYEYDVEVDYEFFGPAVNDYFDANLADESRRRNLPDAATAGQGRSAAHTVVIDAWSRQIVEVRHPLQLDYETILDAQNSGILPASQFNIVPYYSDLIDYLLFVADVQVVTKVLDRDQRIDVASVASGPPQPLQSMYTPFGSSAPRIFSSRIDQCE